MTQRTALILPLAFCLGALHAPGIASAGDDDVARYREIIESYRAGDRVAAVRSISAWKEQAVEDVTTALAADSSPLPDPMPLNAACALHLEVLRGSDVSPDAERIHLGALLRLLRNVRQGAGGEESLAADLHLATAWHLQGQLLLTPLRRLLEGAQAAFPKDARIALTAGSALETLASRRLAAGRAAKVAPDTATSLLEAEERLRHALSLAPALHEARVRLAHVLAEQGKLDAAAGEIDKVLAASVPWDARYLAQLLRARLLQTQNRRSDTAAALAAAESECRCCAVPALASSHLLFVAGQKPAAQRRLAEALEPRDCYDPWKRYDFGQADRVEALMASLRQRLR